MSYNYCNTNLLENPTAYMYSEYRGRDFLSDYAAYRDWMITDLLASADTDPTLDRRIAVAIVRPIKDRAAPESMRDCRHDYWRHVLLHGEDSGDDCGDDSGDDSGEMPKAVPLSEFSVNRNTDTADLLLSLLSTNAGPTDRPEVAVWISRLVQRFEVSKKLYPTYQPGFRKGIGNSDSIRLYWLLGLTLCTQFRTPKGLVYLNCLLKLNDLLCSLPRTMWQGQFPAFGLATTLAVERAWVADIAQELGCDLTQA